VFSKVPLTPVDGQWAGDYPGKAKLYVGVSYSYELSRV
jgi:hypothetical protein